MLKTAFPAVYSLTSLLPYLFKNKNRYLLSKICRQLCISESRTVKVYSGVGGFNLCGQIGRSVLPNLPLRGYAELVVDTSVP